MNQPPKPRILKEVTPQWEEIMRLASQIKFGEITLKLQNGELILAEYKITRRKGEEIEPFEVIPL